VKNYQVRRHGNACRYPGYGWETVLEVLEMVGPMVTEVLMFDLSEISSEGEHMADLWSNGELPGPIFADWIEERATDHYALPRLLSALRNE
jgi:hypothetical protein